VRLRLKADAAAKYSMHVGALSGPTFIASWNNTGIGTGDAAGEIDVRQIFLSARPVTGIDLQAGSLDVWRGESTEITSYDNDGYLTGARIVIKRPDHLFLDEITYAQANLGDLEQPNAFRRLDRIDDLNYRQVGVMKAVSGRMWLSADYTRHSGVGTLRAAARFDTLAWRVLDRLRLEVYRRLDVDEAGGFALTGEKAVMPRLTFSGGMAAIDEHYALIGDRYGRGNHLFGLATIALNRNLAVQGFVGRAVQTDFLVANGTRVDVVLIYDAPR
jgi:hypothetical protein